MSIQALVEAFARLKSPPGLFPGEWLALSSSRYQALVEFLLHMGPGEHPSGSPQKVHAHGGGGGGGGGTAVAEHGDSGFSTETEDPTKTVPAFLKAAVKARPGLTGARDMPETEGKRAVPYKGNIPLTQEETDFLTEVARIPEVQKARKILAEGTSTDTLYFDKKTGTWDPARVAKHDEYVEKFLIPTAVAPPGQKPKIVMFVGPPGAGKSTSLQPLVPNHKTLYTTINADDAKASLPEYIGYNAGLLHEESAHMAEDRLLDAAVNARHNIILDSTGKSWDKYLATAHRFRRNGYDVEVMFADVTNLESARRVTQRFLNPSPGEHPRFVDPQYVLTQVDGRPAQTYNQLKAAGFATRVVHFDNNGERPRKVEDETITPFELRERSKRILAEAPKTKPLPYDKDEAFRRPDPMAQPDEFEEWTALRTIDRILKAKGISMDDDVSASERKLHQGPGSHPSGSPQDVHAPGAGGSTLKTPFAVETEGAPGKWQGYADRYETINEAVAAGTRDFGGRSWRIVDKRYPPRHVHHEVQKT